jgi:hypothetical protein
MYIVQPYKVKYNVFCWNGDIYGVYSSINDFAKYWHKGRHINRFGTHFYQKRDVDPFHYGRYPYWNDTSNGNIYGHFILKNEYGNVIHPDEIDSLLYEYRIEIMKEKGTHYSCYTNRRVPGAKRGGIYRHYRRFKTNHIRKWYNAHDDLGIKKPRNRYIPNTYDDIHRSGNRNNNWKRYRKKQYK